MKGMKEITDIEFSRDECVAAVRDYYAFLAAMYLNDSEVVEPPEGGWPEISQESLRDLGKTDGVVALLRQLPYIRPPENHRSQALPECYFADWPDKAGEDSLRVCSEPVGVNPDDIPPHVVGLTFGGRDNPDVLLDVKHGLIHWGDCPTLYPDWIPPVTVYGADWAPENEQHWRQSNPAWSIPDFFDIMKAQYRELRFIPYSPRRVTQMLENDNCSEEQRRFATMLQNIYREHGWPDLKTYNKEKCMAAVRKAIEANYPDEIWPGDW